jgi:beta-1,4-mannosyl-glycoprotein beta-1,4-N-acetylglucosaminyltransferase
MPRIYDCFTFFNELDLLEIRLNELAPIVDKFVLVEATQTYQGRPKPLYFAMNQSRFKDFIDKIIHIVVDFPPEQIIMKMYPAVSLPWAREYYQRDMIAAGLKDCSPDDVVIISDVDEIPKPRKVLEYLTVDGVKVFEQRLYYYWLNFQCVASPDGSIYSEFRPVMTNYARVRSPQKMRNLAIRVDHEFRSTRVIPRLMFKLYRLSTTILGNRVVVVRDGAWHFSYLGGVERVIEKLRAFAHTEYSTSYWTDKSRLTETITKGMDLFGRGYVFKPVPLDTSFPMYVLNNMDRLSTLIYNERR